MGKYRSSVQLFFELLRAGLWERPARVASYLPIDWNELYSLTNQQTVLGLITAGIGHIEDVKVTKTETRQFIVDIGGLVVRNGQMNDSIASLVRQLEGEGISAVLVKGQGIAQCYERPLWRSCGDIDLLLDADSYSKAKAYLIPLASIVDEEVQDSKHLAMHLDSFEVELHGTLRSLRNSKMDRVLDSVLSNMFTKRDFLIWDNNGTAVAIPAPNTNVLIIFAHIIQHFFNRGIGIRQVCDWCRLMWTYKDEIDLEWLESRLQEMMVMSEWKAFGCVAVNYLGFPRGSMPFYDSAYDRKADRVVKHILTVGNFGRNRDESYMRKYPYVIRKTISLWRRSSDSLQHLRIFPMDALRYYFRMLAIGTDTVIKGK